MQARNSRRFSRHHSATRFARHLRWLVAATVLSCGIGSAAWGAVIFVTDPTDALPAPPGSLRWAIELSESNGEPDEIQILIDVDMIALVAPLPTLFEGGLRVGDPPGVTDLTPSGGALTLNGGGTVTRALAIASAKNIIAGFGFEGFTGSEILWVRGPQAGDNLIAGCEFLGPGDGAVTPAAGVRVTPGTGDPDLPRGNVVRHSRFDGLGWGVLVDGPPAPTGTANQPPAVTLLRNWFGLDRSGEPTNLANGTAIEARRSGALVVAGNRIAGPGDGIFLEQAPGSRIRDNQVGIFGNLTPLCVGVDGPGIELRGSANAWLLRNHVQCSQSGALVGVGSDDAFVEANELGSRLPGGGNAAAGLRLDDVDGGRVRANRMQNNGGSGVVITDPDLIGGNTLSCNTIVGNGGPPISAPGVPTPPPVLTAANALRVQGTQSQAAPGWIEMFGDAGSGPGVFQGSTRLAQDQTDFNHPLPVLGLGLGKTAADPASAVIDFATEDPPSHVATATSEPRAETSEVSGDVASNNAGLVFDVIRGQLEALAAGAAGGVNLGPVTCLAAGIPAANLPVLDDLEPASGHAFFYVARRRLQLTNQPGTYDPAKCVLDARSFSGPRQAESGDCGP